MVVIRDNAQVIKFIFPLTLRFISLPGSRGAAPLPASHRRAGKRGFSAPVPPGCIAALQADAVTSFGGISSVASCWWLLPQPPNRVSPLCLCRAETERGLSRKHIIEGGCWVSLSGRVWAPHSSPRGVCMARRCTGRAQTEQCLQKETLLSWEGCAASAVTLLRCQQPPGGLLLPRPSSTGWLPHAGGVQGGKRRTEPWGGLVVAARGTREHQAGHLCFTAPRHGSQQPPRCCLTHFCLLARSSVGGTRGSPGAVHELPKLPKPRCGVLGSGRALPAAPGPLTCGINPHHFPGAVAQGSSRQLSVVRRCWGKVSGPVSFSAPVNEPLAQCLHPGCLGARGRAQPPPVPGGTASGNDSKTLAAVGMVSQQK